MQWNGSGAYLIPLLRPRYRGSTLYHLMVGSQGARYLPIYIFFRRLYLVHAPI